MTTIIQIDNLKLAVSLNVMLNEHWSARKKRKDKIIWFIKSQTKNKHPGKVKITYLRRAIKKMDWDNFGSSFKSIGDALVDAKVIKEDNPDLIDEWAPKQEKIKIKKDQLIIIVIEDIL